MYKFYFNKINNTYELNEMVRMFIPTSSYTVLSIDPKLNWSEHTDDVVIRIPDNIIDKNQGKRWLYNCLSKYTKIKPDWGVLTGVRPVKLTGELIKAYDSPEKAKTALVDEYYLSEAKAELLIEIWKIQQGIEYTHDIKAIGIYIGIPFCPSRCVYCSFPSYQAPNKGMGEYLNALLREITAVGTYLSNKGWYPESIYVGGGTPTILSAGEMRALLTCIENNLDMTQIKEITVEAGRPDTIDREKLEGLKEAGVERISINPQSMKSDTLDLIGRNHEPETIIEAYKIARNTGFPIINMDLIAGLPGEKLCDFQSSLNRILDLHPENITIHTLAVKRASKLKTIDAEYSYRQGELVKEMLDYGQDILKKSGYSPYYLYRQKQMTGNLENVGYALPGTESIYNIRIMEENQNIIAMGAGGISKFIYPEENRLERIPNVSNYEIYIERIDEMINRKLKHIQ